MHQLLDRAGWWFSPWLKHEQFTELVNKNFESDVKEKASIYVSAIGKVTIVMLLRNLLVSRNSNEIAKPRLNLRSDSSKIEKQGRTARDKQQEYRLPEQDSIHVFYT